MEYNVKIPQRYKAVCACLYTVINVEEECLYFISVAVMSTICAIPSVTTISFEQNHFKLWVKLICYE